jgi:hypothetical protein
VTEWLHEMTRYRGVVKSKQIIGRIKIRIIHTRCLP